MPIANIRGAAINYHVLGSNGPWVALSPGGRRGMDAVEGLASRLAAKGYRVLIHDRRTPARPNHDRRQGIEYEIWADDLHALLAGARRIAGRGRRLVIGLPDLAPVRAALSASSRALLLWRVTGGRFACERLAENYYGQFIKLAQSGGMHAVAEVRTLGRAHPDAAAEP